MRVGERADRQTDRQIDVTKLRLAFRNFANTPKNKIRLCDLN
jgi:hypothetical protein